MRAVELVVLLGLVVHAPCAKSAPSTASVSIRQVVDVVDFGDLSVSPDGRLVAFRTEQASIERNTYDTVWYVQPIDGTSSPRRLGEGGAPLRGNGGLSVHESAVWSPDGKWIFYRAVFDGRVEVWRAAVDGSRTEPVTHDPANVCAFSLSADGSVLKYSVGATREAVVNAELAEYDHGIHIDRTVPLGDSLFRSGYREGRLATQRLVGGSGLEFVPLLSQVPDRWKAIDISTGVRKDIPSGDVPASPLTPSDLSPKFRKASQLVEDRGNGRIAILTCSGKQKGLSWCQTFGLAMLPKRSASQSVRCVVKACVNKRITDIVWRPESDEIIFTVTAPDNGQSIFRWNVVSGVVRPVVQSRGQIGGGERWEPGPCGVSSDALVCVAAEADHPPRLERIDLELGQRSVLFDPNVALAHDMAASVPVLPISWTDAQGTRFTGQFYPATAKGHKPPPLFIVYYRCSGFLRGGMGDEWPLATLAENGIAALCINASPLQEDAVKRFGQGRAAIESVTEYLASRGDIDPAQVGVGGLSFGAEVAMWTAMNSRIPRAISVSNPVWSPLGYLLYSLWGDAQFSRIRRYWQLGSLEETPKRWRLLSPFYNIGRIRVPVLMQMSEREYNFSLDYAVPLIRAHLADVYVFPNEPHQKFQPRHKLAVYERNLDWFRFWLRGYEDPNPTKKQQYAHWREMRDAISTRAAWSAAHSGG
ncbi:MULTISPECIES: Atxe2 family lasso peptide isopeptidase [Rhodanobacter]|uniref:Atxe2 family lasso peptide isopeptidase n=1 Tax=Rhodanobacter TaxID=75309 RepID=UPI001E44EA09|nr:MULTISPECIES: Atxe2 family lasso peptide isopeptidase [Rhodanobacter]UJJ50979.1 Atxe2 family lasso peptide isopeptidase [Rhodanobacter denitrificans]UJM93692.1 Atxe2 family lasso peptide isopeptidase [Rhodanobacter denitrificans]UJM97223.1 Atxe2 family lasso peptide isopeptidase [Rhodanobacter denitrificans]UJN19949.1 Atxe2 family lasso peptide isopeptidase [Rhodanobacter denitrificans]